MRVRKLSVVTTSRADYGLLRYTIEELRHNRRLSVELVVGGSHLARVFGSTISEIRRDKTPIGATIRTTLRGDGGVDAAVAMGAALQGFARAFHRLEPDIVVVLGDRYEMLAAAAAAALDGRVVAHIGGGEVSAGSLDEGWRNAISKIAHVHFVATREARARVRAMGEDAWRIHVVGAPGLDAIRRERRMSVVELASDVAHDLSRPLAICTYHPVTNDAGATKAELPAMLTALRRSSVGTVVFTSPNADADGRWVLAEIRGAMREDARFVLVPNLGSGRYLSLLEMSDVMIGNSSSGLIEAPSFRLPVVDVGSRQDGRLQARNVIDARTPREIAPALQRALSPAFRRGLRGVRNPYGDGRTSERISRALSELTIDADLRRKRFAEARPRYRRG